MPETRPLRILVAHDVPRARTGGMSRLMGRIHDRVQAAGHQVDWFDADSVPPGGTGVRRRLMFAIRLRRQLAAARKAGRPYDIVNVHEPLGAACVVRSPEPRCRVVVTTHGLEERAWQLAIQESRLGRAAPSRLRLAARWIATVLPSRLALRRADHVFCLNEADRRYLGDRLGVPAERTTRIVPGADPVFAAAGSARRYDSCRRIVFAGSWRKNKGIEDLVPAIQALARRFDDLELWIVGSGSPEAAVLRAFQPDLYDRVRCLPSVSQDEMAAVLAGSDVFLLPSLFEGTPLTLIEAMASGLPVVTTATCGMADVVRDGENGLLVPVRAPDRIVAAVERLRADAALRSRIGTRARDDARSLYTWERAAEPVLRAYERLAHV